jgi:TetR/AcrR family transcriptional regulator, regulator of cefoperazone and chloramphenicol sensitivity
MPDAGTSRRRTRARQATNGDDPGTRQRLLDVAGQVFAEKGVDRATGKEICARAKTNVAAINYHFGSFDRLYEAVLCEAHRRLATVESIQSAVAAAGNPEAKLEAVFRLIVSSLSGPISSSWVIRVLGREIVSPSRAISVLREKEVRPKVRVVLGVVAELMGLPVDHPAVTRGCVSVIAPCIMLLIVDRRTFTRLFPHFEIAPDNAEAIVHHLTRFAVAGLTAVAAEINSGK